MIPTRLPSRRTALARIAALALGVSVGAASAEGAGRFPDRPITWLVGYPPGGSVDVMTRLVARRVEATLGQPVVVANRPGASGALALNAAAKAAPDGYTLVTVPGPVLTSMATPEVGHELGAVAMLGQGPMVLVGTMATPMPATLKALLATAKADPDRYSFGSSGNGTSQHLAGELVNQMAGTRMTHVPYKGGTQAVTDVIGGQIPLAMLGITPVLPQIKAGKLHAYGVSTGKRAAALPNVPTLAEAGLPGFEASQWFVVAAPAGVPADRVALLDDAIRKALQAPETVAGFADLGVTATPASPGATLAFVTVDLKRWRELAKRTGLALD